MDAGANGEIDTGEVRVCNGVEAAWIDHRERHRDGTSQSIERRVEAGECRDRSAGQGIAVCARVDQ